MPHANAATHHRPDTPVQILLDKEAIRELVLLYARAIDRRDIALLRDLYAEGATDTHGDAYDGDAEGFCDGLETALARYNYTGNHTCNHLISVDGDTACGEVYALALHCLPDPQDPGALIEDLMAVRYLDQYRRCADGKWRFASRFVTFDMRMIRPYTGTGLPGDTLPGDTLPGFGAMDPSYALCAARLFQPGARA